MSEGPFTRSMSYSFGGKIPDTDRCAFRYSDPDEASVPILVAVPHAGRHYPPAVLQEMRHGESAAIRLEDRYVDLIAEGVARGSGAAILVADAPRAMLDLNRSAADIDWSMVFGEKPGRPAVHPANRRARNGLGLIPRRLASTGEVWKRPLPRASLDDRIRNIHKPYHEALEALLERLLDYWGAVLLLDLHSMPPLRRRYSTESAAEFVVGDRFGSSCDPRIASCAIKYLGDAMCPVAHNRPYAGGYILDRHGAPTKGLHAMQLEVCRTTYLDCRLDSASARLPAIVRLLTGLVSELAFEVASLVRDGGVRQAAE